MIILRTPLLLLKQKEYGKKTSPTTLDLTNLDTFREYQDTARMSENKARLKDMAKKKIRSKGNKSANKASNRSYLIKKGSFRGRRLGLSPEVIEQSANQKLTHSNPDWNNPMLGDAQEKILRRERELQKHIKEGVIGSGDKLTKEERWERLSNETKRKFKARQTNERAALEVTTPKTKTDRIKSLNSRYLSKFRDSNSKRLYGKSRQEVRMERFKNRGIDPLEGKNATIRTSKGNIIVDQAHRDYFRSKEYRKSLLSDKSREILNKKSLERSRKNNLLPALVTQTTTSNTSTKIPETSTNKVINDIPKSSTPNTKTNNVPTRVIDDIPKSSTNSPKSKFSNGKVGNNVSSKSKNVLKHLKNPLVAGTLIGSGLLAGGIALSRKKKQKDKVN